jgi:hypothetical protein
LRKPKQWPPNGTILQRLNLPLLRAMLAMHRGDPALAIEELRPAETYELVNWSTVIPAPYVRGYAYLTVGDPKSAAAEFQAKWWEHALRRTSGAMLN